MRGFVVIFEGAYEIASLSSRKIRRWGGQALIAPRVCPGQRAAKASG